MRFVSKVHEGKVHHWSVRHDHGIGINVGINVEVRSESWVAGASGLPVVLSRFELLCFLGLIKCVLMSFVVGC